MHTDKSRIIPLVRGIDFVGFRNFYYYRLLRKRNIRNMQRKIELYRENIYYFGKIFDSYNGWKVYALWANTHKIKEKIKLKIIDIMFEKI